MQDILTCAMGLDIHRDVIVACLAKGELGTDPEIEIRSFSTLIPEMRKLRDWVLEAECRYVAMESTGIYWQPKRATIALARKLLALIYTMLKTGSPYNEDCFEIRRKQSERKRASRMVNELQKLGYFVVAPG